MTRLEKRKKIVEANVKKWLKALRSGDYKQGRKALRSTDDKFCCLGVACDVLGMKGRISGSIYNYSGYCGILPPCAQMELGLESPAGTFTSKIHGSLDLTYINDEYKRSFKQIAKLIESQPEELFDPKLGKLKLK